MSVFLVVQETKKLNTLRLKQQLDKNPKNEQRKRLAHPSSSG
jgi:hypothetical protein